MKVRGKPGSEWDLAKEEKAAATATTSPGKKDTKPWYSSEYINWEVVANKMPKLKNVHGSKRKIQFSTFSEIWKDGQQIFECNRDFFRYRAEVDMMAHYLGIRLLQHRFILMKGIARDPLSDLIESKEYKMECLDKLDVVHDVANKLFEAHVNGFLSKQEMMDEIEEYIATLDDEWKEKAYNVIDHMLDTGGLQRAKDRLRQRNWRKENDTPKTEEVD
jgi:hypothetical protein